jgi:hypothetical protein
MGLIVFPFINNLAIKKIAKIDDRQFNKLMEERREKIPVWIKAMFAVT